MAESELRAAIARMRESVARAERCTIQFQACDIEIRDVKTIFAAIRRYGGRRDWTPTPDNIAQLPAPVRRYIYAQWVEIARLQQEALRAASAAREAEAELARHRQSPR